MTACPSCGSPVAEAARFCPTCGGSLGAACPSCGAPVSGIARFCESCGAALGPAPGHQEERKLVTILFADVTGSTALGERLDPERLRSLLTAYFSAMSAVIESWGGTVEKFIGDAIMAVFGAPVVREDDAERALRAATAMLARLDELNTELLDRHGVELQIRIGVNTGEVIAPVGVAIEQMIVVGDAVNVAARLEQTAESGSIVVGDATYLSARDAFDFAEPSGLDLKGKAESVSARRLLGARTELSRGIPGLSAAMVGRDLELESLVGLFEEAVGTGRPRIVTVFGPAGMGKSRLVREFLRLASSRVPEPAVLRGRCLAAGPGITYWALGEILRAACGIALDDPASEAERKLRGIGDLLGGLGISSDETQRTVFSLATTAGVALAGNPLDAMDPQAVADELARAWPRFATALAQRGPTILVVEDLHWASDQLLELLERLATRSTGPLLVVSTARPEFSQGHPGFGAAAEEMSSISLRPLTEDQSARLVEDLLAEADLPQRLREEILDKAEGNPFFLEELLRRLIDEGALVREGGRWTVTAAAQGVALPETVQGLLAARIDALGASEKRVLQEAAVVGRIFWQEPVARAVANGDASAALRELERKGLVIARPVSGLAGQIEYTFKHALVREVAYASLPKTRRARAHAEHAVWVEELAGERTDEFVDILAYHYEHAAADEDADLAWAGEEVALSALRERAYGALLAAGKVARRRFALDRAVELHERSVALASTDAAAAAALEELGRDHDLAYHGEAGFDAYLRALDLVRRGAGTGADRVRLCVAAGRLAAKSGPFKEPPAPTVVESLVDEGLEHATDEEDRSWLLGLRGAVGYLGTWSPQQDPGDLKARIDAAEEAWLAARSLHVPELSSFLVWVLQALYDLAGDDERSFEVAHRALEFVDLLPSAQRAEDLFSVSFTDLYAARYEDAERLSRQGYELSHDMSAHARMHSTFILMSCAYYTGRWSELAPLIEEHIELYGLEPGVTCTAVRGGPVMAALALADLGDAERALEVAGRVPTETEHGTSIAGLHARIRLALGDPGSARRLVEEALAAERGRIEVSLAMVEALAELGDWDALLNFLPKARADVGAMALIGPAADRAEGRMLCTTGDLERGVSLLREALANHERLGVPFEAARTREYLAAIVGGDEGKSLFKAALATYVSLAARPHVERARAALSSA